jgi:siroheme synthase
MANALRAKAIVLPLRRKELSKAVNARSSQTIALVFQVNVRPETVTVLKASAHPDNLTTADLAQMANAPQETLRHALRANMKPVHRVSTSPALPVVTTMTSNPAPMRT